MELWFWILGGILSVINVVGNGSVIFLIASRRRLHTTANWFVLSLAVADFSFGVFHLPLEKLHEVYFKTNHHGTFSIYMLVIIVLVAASVTNLCAMTLDRYIAIVHPLRYVTFMRPRRVALLITSAWVMALTRALFHSKHTTAFSQVVMRLDSVLYQVIPAIALLLATVHILLIVRRHSKQTAALLAQLRHNYPLRSLQENRASRNQIASTQTREAISAKVVMVVVGVFLIYLGLNVFLQFSYTHDGIIFNIFQISTSINSAVNPFAYAFFKTDVRREMAVYVCCSKENQCRPTFESPCHKN